MLLYNNSMEEVAGRPWSIMRHGGMKIFNVSPDAGLPSSQDFMLRISSLKAILYIS